MTPDPYSDIWDTDAEEEMIAFCSMFGYWAPLEIPCDSEDETPENHTGGKL